MESINCLSAEDFASLNFSPAQILHHSKIVQKKHEENPEYAARYLNEILANSGYFDSEDADILSVKLIIEQLKNEIGRKLERNTPEKNINDGDSHNLDLAGTVTAEQVEKISKEILFRKQIEEYYLPKQLIDTIFEIGEIPQTSVETYIGIGFLDIANYTFLSKLLSPMENQALLNGLFTAFNWVLKRHGGYLNKIEGDSIMFHFGGLIDPRVKNFSEKEARQYIVRELFYSCVEMQRVCSLFNQANDRFIFEKHEEKTKETLQKAFAIISMLRNNLDLASSVNALFQIRIRIGANIGIVTIGNFGPDGAKQWDVVGLPVIDAKRMEATAPVGGLRISEHFFEVLRDTGVVDAYFQRFKREAMALGGYYKEITQEDLFKLSRVVLKDKRNAEFITYSVQVNPGLPEDIAGQVKLLLDRSEAGADSILDILQYYRGNKYVINAIENVFKNAGIMIQKDKIIKIIYPQKYDAFYIRLNRDEMKTAEYFNTHYTLFKLMEKLGNYQDKIKNELNFYEFQLSDINVEYDNYHHYLAREIEKIKMFYKVKKKAAIHRMYFYNMVYPLVFKYIRTGILEYQKAAEVLEEI
ncbi:MAG: adenylate/guanylate cyclase domain-containing protein [Spirochaetota bacterium]